MRMNWVNLAERYRGRIALFMNEDSNRLSGGTWS